MPDPSDEGYSFEQLPASNGGKRDNGERRGAVSYQGPNRDVDEHERRKARDRARKTYSPDPTRLLPQSPDAEKGALSSMLQSSKELVAEALTRGVAPEWFFIPAHALIYMRMIELWNCNEPIDFISLTQHLRDLGQLDQVGGAAFVTELFTFLPTAANFLYYLTILEEKFTLREMIRVGTLYVQVAYDEQDRVKESLDDFERDVLSIRIAEKSGMIHPSKELVVGCLNDMEALWARRGSISGMSTGYPTLDHMIDGLLAPQFYVIAARPSQGKTALAMNIADHLAVELGKSVGVFSLEMDKKQLIQRMVCARARVDLANLRDGYLADNDFPRINAAASKLGEAKLYIDDESDLSIQELRARARRMKQRYGIQVLFVDYLQLLKSNTRRAQNNRQQEVAEISAGLKAIAKELHIPVIVLAQLNRPKEEGQNFRPRLQDLRESGAIEQDADFVGMLVRPETFAESPEEKEKYKGRATLIVAKQRNGPLGDVYLTFLKEYTRFEERAFEGDDEACGQGDFGI